MPDPVWTNQYATNQTPEQNGFTRVTYGSPVVLTQTSGPAANRRVEINSDGGSCVFTTSSVPSLDTQVGATTEMVVAVSGAGDAGVEMTFLDLFAAVQVYQNKITVTVADGNPPSEHPTASNAADTTVRITIGSGTLSVYRNGSPVASRPLPAYSSPSQRVLWWGEEGGVQTFRALRFYLGGAVPPG